MLLTTAKLQRKSFAEKSILHSRKKRYIEIKELSAIRI